MKPTKISYTKAKTWNGKNLKGTWEATLKIDGVRMLRDTEGNPVSRAGKPLYNLQDIPKEIRDAEIYLGSWEKTVSAVRTHDSVPVSADAAYTLSPLDSRLTFKTLVNPSSELIENLMAQVVSEGYEGLILRQGYKWLRVKPKRTADLKILGFQPGTGKHKGRMGALMTKAGKIGTGFTDAQRELFQRMYDEGTLLGVLIEVEYMELTKANKMRHPRFLCVRTDKTEESFDEADE